MRPTPLAQIRAPAKLPEGNEWPIPPGKRTKTSQSQYLLRLSFSQNMKKQMKDYHHALGVLKRYYELLGKEMADEIIANEEDFETIGLNQADAIIDKYSVRLRELASVYSFLKWTAMQHAPSGAETLGENEFRCFGCGAVIRREEQTCQVCGWTWR